MSMKGNKLIFSRSKEDRIKGYKKLLKSQKENYQPSKAIAADIVEAMEAQGHEVTVAEAAAYLISSYAVHDRRYYLEYMKK
tara:strand:- start:925 stop:1167 length:243 start_codon:yes stop_codon:yes gene_type:complete